jgi:hypothetical protein
MSQRLTQENRNQQQHSSSSSSYKQTRKTAMKAVQRISNYDRSTEVAAAEQSRLDK